MRRRLDGIIQQAKIDEGGRGGGGQLLLQSFASLKCDFSYCSVLALLVRYRPSLISVPRPELKPPDFAVVNALIQNGTVNAGGGTPLFTGTFDFTLTAKNPNKYGTTLIYAFNATQVKVGLEYDIFLIDGSGAYNRQRLRHGYVDLASTAASAMVPPFNQTGGNVTTLPLSLQANGVALDGNATITIEAQKNASTAIFATIEVNAVILIQKGDSEPKPRGLLVRCDAVFSYSSSPQQSSNDDEPDCRSHLCSGSNFNCTDEF